MDGEIGMRLGTCPKTGLLDRRPKTSVLRPRPKTGVYAGVILRRFWDKNQRNRLYFPPSIFGLFKAGQAAASPREGPHIPRPSGPRRASFRKLRPTSQLPRVSPRGGPLGPT